MSFEHGCGGGGIPRVTNLSMFEEGIYTVDSGDSHGTGKSGQKLVQVQVIRTPLKCNFLIFINIFQSYVEFLWLKIDLNFLVIAPTFNLTFLSMCQVGGVRVFRPSKK